MPDSIENRKVVCRACQVAFTVPGVGGDGATGQAAAEQSDASFGGGMFDSLDVDNLLNAKSSGLSQRRPDPNSSAEQAESGDAQQRTEQPVAERSAAPNEEPLFDAQPAERPAALPITVLDRSKKKSKGKKKKKNKKKRESPVADAEDESALIDAQSDPFEERKRSSDPIDPEEQAVFDYVQAVNRRKNNFATILALVIAIALGGWFAVKEIDRLKAPLTAKERGILEDEGFRLKACLLYTSPSPRD